MSKAKKKKRNEEWLARLFERANLRAIDVVGTFVALINSAVRMYPSGELYEFLADQTVIFAGCIIEGGMVRIDDMEWFFSECGFDAEKVGEMVKVYEGLAEVSRRLDAGEQLMLWEANK